MARILKIKDLEEKKRALAEECDLYRQTLALEVHNLRLQAAWTKRRVASVTTGPLWTILPPLLNTLSRKKIRQSSKWRILSTAFALWQVYRKFTGFASIFTGFRHTPSAKGEGAPAATI